MEGIAISSVRVREQIADNVCSSVRFPKDVDGRMAPLDSTKLSKASYDQEPWVEVQVPYMAHLFGVSSLVIGDVRLVIRLDQGLNFLSGPSSLGKLRVLSAWIPALCSPLKRVTVSGQPAICAASGEPNHKPRWNVWTGSV